MWLKRVANFIVLGTVKLLARLFYRVENKWLHKHESDPWTGVKLIAFLNHTSLYEPLFLGAAPWRMLWRIAGRMVIPTAATTMKRPITGKILGFIAPHNVPISRLRDSTWDKFLEAIKKESVVIILPEGRMQRANGLDKNGRPMSVKGGVADILEIMPNGEMVIIYSGGLHHVAVPGQLLPKLFKHIQIRCEKLNIQNYVNELKQIPDATFRAAVISDMEARLARNKPNTN